MSSVEDLILRHPLAAKFEGSPELVDATFVGASQLSPRGQLLLQPFVRERPQKFFNVEAYAAATALFDQVDSAEAAALPQGTVDEVTEALRFLRLVNTSAEDASRKSDAH